MNSGLAYSAGALPASRLYGALNETATRQFFDDLCIIE